MVEARRQNCYYYAAGRFPHAVETAVVEEASQIRYFVRYCWWESERTWEAAEVERQIHPAAFVVVVVVAAVAAAAEPQTDCCEAEGEDGGSQT